jgi:hypothetical protein
MASYDELRLNSMVVVRFLLGNSPASEFIQMPGNCPEESIQHSEHGESLKSRAWWLF